MTDVFATVDIAAKYFKNRTHFNNSKRCFLNEYQILVSPAIQYNSFQRVHFLRKLSKLSINMTDVYATPDLAAKFFKNRTHLQQQISHQPNAIAMFFKRICYADVTSCPINVTCKPKSFDFSKMWAKYLIIGQRSFDISSNINEILLHCY